MSFPTIPDVSPTIDIKPEDAFALLLASIAFEELGLSHLINAEGERLQSAIGIVLSNPGAGSVSRLLEANKSVDNVLKDIIKEEMLLAMKADSIVDFINTGTCNCKLLGKGSFSLLGGETHVVDATGPALRYFFESQILPPPNIATIFDLTADPATTKYTCRLVNGVKTVNVQGTGVIEVADAGGTRIVPGSFNLNVADTGVGNDSFIMQLKSDDGTVDFNSGVVTINEGDLIVGCV